MSKLDELRKFVKKEKKFDLTGEYNIGWASDNTANVVIRRSAWDNIYAQLGGSATHPNAALMDAGDCRRASEFFSLLADALEMEE